MVNGRDFIDYFKGATTNMIINQPFTLLDNNNAWDVVANVHGGGITGQAEAIKLGIARALVLADENNRKTLRSGGFLTRDPREVLRKIYGRAKARKRFQFSKR
jgi:small subunit ribosomal protein S9